MPRSPTKVTRSALKRAAALFTCEENVLTSDVAFEDLDRQWATVGVGEQADHDLTLARLAIPVVAERGEGVVLAFEVCAGHVVEKDVGRRGQFSLSKQPALDLGLV